MKRVLVLVAILVSSVMLVPYSSHHDTLDSKDVTETVGRDSLITYWKHTEQFGEAYSSEEVIPNKNEILICESAIVKYEPRNYIYSLNTMSIVHYVDISCGSDTHVSPNFILVLQEEDESGNYGYYDVYETNNYQKVRTISFFGDQNLKADHIEISEDGEHIYAYEDSIYRLVKYNTSSWSIESSKDFRIYGGEFSLSDDLILSFYKYDPSGNYYSSCGYRTLNSTTLNQVTLVALDYKESGFWGSTCSIDIDSVNIVGDFFLERTGTSFSLRNISTKAFLSQNVQLGDLASNYIGYFSFDVQEDGLTFMFNMDDDENRSEHLLLWRNVIPLIQNSNGGVISQPSDDSIERIEYERHDTKPCSSGSCFEMFDDDTILLHSFSTVYVYEQKVGYDSDDDLVVDSEDNCPSTPNAEQENYDNDDDGDSCDNDYDNDGITNNLDQCSKGILNWISDIYIDFDSDGCLDALEDLDDDNDGVDDTIDECPYDSNYTITPEQGCGNLPEAPKPDESGPKDDLPSELENELDTSKDKSLGFASKILPYSSIILNVILLVYIISRRINSKSENDDLTTMIVHNDVEHLENEMLQNEIEFEKTDIDMHEKEDSKDEIVDSEKPTEQDNTNKLSKEDLERFPGWDEAIITPYLEQGWTLDSLEDYYKEQKSQLDSENQE